MLIVKIIKSRKIYKNVSKTKQKNTNKTTKKMFEIKIGIETTKNNLCCCDDTNYINRNKATKRQCFPHTTSYTQQNSNG